MTPPLAPDRVRALLAELGCTVRAPLSKRKVDALCHRKSDKPKQNRYLRMIAEGDAAEPQAKRTEWRRMRRKV